MKGKFGRVLGDFLLKKKKISKILCEEGHAVAYFGGSKKNIQAKHMKNRQKLVKQRYCKRTNRINTHIINKGIKYGIYNSTCNEILAMDNINCFS